MSTFSKQTQWKIAKVTKHGYSYFEDGEELKNVLIALKKANIPLQPGTEFGKVEDGYLLQPNKLHGRKIAKFIRKEFGIEPENYFGIV